MCLSRIGTVLVLLRGITPTREFHVDRFVYDLGTIRLFVPGEIRFISVMWIVLIKRTSGFTGRVRVFLDAFFMKKCTRNKHGRTLWRWEHAEVLDELRERMLREPEKLASRKRIVEHPFGTMEAEQFKSRLLLSKGT